MKFYFNESLTILHKVIFTVFSITTILSQTFYDKEVMITTESLNYSVTNYGKIESRIMSPKMNPKFSGNKDIIYNASVWLGIISDNNDTLVTSGDGNQTTTCSEWHTTENVDIMVFQSDSSSYQTSCNYTDLISLENHQPIGLSITQTTTSWDDIPGIVYSFNIKNGSGSTLDDLYAGLKVDFDLSDHGENDAIELFPAGDYPYIFNDSTYTAVTNLNLDETSFSFWNRDEDPQSDSEKYNLLISSTPDDPPAELGDYRILSKIGLPELAPDDSTTVSFLIVCGNNHGVLNSYIHILKSRMGPGMLPRILTPVYESNKDTSQIISQSFSFGSYPNPFNPVVKINFYLPDKSNVNIKIFDILGREIVELTDREYPTGNHSIVWDGIVYQGRKASTGMYFAHIETEKESGTIKLIMVR